MTDAVTVRVDGKAEMAYVDDAPWHRLGNKLEAGASIEDWTKAAGFDFEIKTASVMFETEHGMQKVDDRKVVYRADTDLALGHVSDMYKVVQPTEVMEYFARLADKAGITLETAGTLYGGRKYWALAKIGKDATIMNPHDKVGAYLLLASSADGQSQTTGKFTTVRVVCQNTLTAALRGGGEASKQGHKAAFDANKMDRALGIQLEEQFAETMKIFRKMAKTPMSRADMARATLLAFEPEVISVKVEKIPTLLKSKHVKAVNELAMNNSIIGGNLLTHDTAAVWLNAVTQQIDHKPGYRSVDRAADRSLFGRGADLKQRAFTLANDYTTGKLPVIAGLDDGTLENMLAEANA